MGIGFVILIHFVMIFALASIIAIVLGIATYFISDKIKRKRKVFLAIFIPYQALFSFYILFFIGTVIISEDKKIDVGIGDHWYVPVNKTCSINMIDLMENAYLDCDGLTIADDIIRFQEIRNKLIGEMGNGEFFSLDLNSNKIETYKTKEELIESEGIEKLTLTDTEDYYHSKKDYILGNSMFLVFAIALSITLLINFVFYRLILFGRKLGFDKK